MTSFFGVDRRPSPADEQLARDVKRLIWIGLQRALPAVVPRSAAGVLVDLTYGEPVAREALAAGLRVAVPIEASGRPAFSLERDDWPVALDDVNPTWAKVLVRYNAGGDAEMNERQRAALAPLSEHLQRTGRGLMFELLVPPEDDQLASVGGDIERYDREIRPALMRRAIDELLVAGVEPDVWKIEGLDRPEDCEAVAVHAQARGRDHVRCIVLGRGRDAAAVEGWLRAARDVEGFAGFAIGRSIWWDAARGYVDASTDLGMGEAMKNEALDAATASIAERYLRFIDVYSRHA